MWSPPDSGKPADVHVDSILNWEDATLASSWLTERIASMENQINERGQSDPEWAKRVGLALERTTATRNRLNHLAIHYRKREK
ncbi:hypothetical protein UFOVP28_1, partial [uncultured Caudovirales phage]